MRKKRFDLCQVQLCARPTVSGEKERDVSKRFCQYHDPQRMAAMRQEITRGRVTRGICRQGLRLVCKTKPSQLLTGTETCIAPAHALFTPDALCFNRDAKWGPRSRARCREPSNAGPRAKSVVTRDVKALRKLLVEEAS